MKKLINNIKENIIPYLAILLCGIYMWDKLLNTKEFVEIWQMIF
jgi:hypothetical protein